VHIDIKQNKNKIVDRPVEVSCWCI
jgi:hypothetical protein